MNGAINRILYVSLLFSVGLYPCDDNKIKNLKNLMLFGSLADFNERKHELNDLPSSDMQDLKRYHQDMQKGFNAIEEVYANPHLKYCLEEMLQEIASKRLDVDLFIKESKQKAVSDVSNDYQRAIQLLYYIGTDAGHYISTTRTGIKRLPEDKAKEHINEEKSRLARIAAILKERSEDNDDNIQ